MATFYVQSSISHEYGHDGLGTAFDVGFGDANAAIAAYKLQNGLEDGETLRVIAHDPAWFFTVHATTTVISSPVAAPPSDE